MTCPEWMVTLKLWIIMVELQRVKSLSKMEHNLKDNGLTDSEMVKVFKNGQMVQDMTAHGVTIKPMETSMKDGG